MLNYGNDMVNYDTEITVHMTCKHTYLMLVIVQCSIFNIPFFLYSLLENVRTGSELYLL